MMLDSNYAVSVGCIAIPVDVVEEGEDVEDQLNPAFHLAPVDYVHVEDGGGVIQPCLTHDRPMEISAHDMRPMTHDT